MCLEQASRFFSEWERLHSPSTAEEEFSEWREFFSRWEQLVPEEVAPPQKPCWNELICVQFESFAREFTTSYEAYRRSGAMTNIWRTVGLGHDELRNCQVLSWMLDRFGDHGQGSVVLERIVDAACKQRTVSQLVSVTAKDVRENNYWTRIESLPLGALESRVDIEIESPAFLIFIEVKIRAPETGDQLKRYVDLAREKACGRPTMVIFLTPNGRLPVNTNLHCEVSLLSWKQIASILEKYTSYDLKNSFTSHIFRQFADHARHLS